jgi:hypothetical protein
LLPLLPRVQFDMEVDLQVQRDIKQFLNRREQRKRRGYFSVTSVSSCSILFIVTSPVRVGKHEAGDTVGQFFDVEVDEQAQRDIQQFHVAQELCLVDG